MTDTLAQRAYGAFAEYVPGPPWEELPEPVRVAWNTAAMTVLHAAMHPSGVPAPILDVPRPYIPEIRIFGVVHELRHPLQNTAEVRKRVSELSAKYASYVEAAQAGTEVTEGQRRAMYDDMGTLISLFIPTLSAEDRKLLDDTDRYAILGACFKAYEDVFARMQAKRATTADYVEPDVRAAMDTILATTRPEGQD